MNFRWHSTSGVVAGLAACALHLSRGFFAETPVLEILGACSLIFTICVLGALICDCDSEDSLIRRFLSLVVAGGLSGVYLLFFPGMGIAAFIIGVLLFWFLSEANLVKHRSRPHSISFGAVYGVVVAGLIYFVLGVDWWLLTGVCAFLSVWVHLALDRIPLKVW